MHDITNQIDSASVLNWQAPDGEWILYSVFQAPTGQQVKRASPGGEGNVMDFFSSQSLENYLASFGTAFSVKKGKGVRAFYNDSYEVYRANWTSDFFNEFIARRGYDLRPYLPMLAGFGAEEWVARIKCDYRETVSELLLNEFTVPWVKWSHEKGSITRNQAHGSPGNLLDLYAAADIPETEIFGPSFFEIPGLRVDADFPDHNNKPDPLLVKFASSAAHVTGKNLVSSESCTWLGEHFKVALSQVKPEIDQLFVAGINHVFYHGMTYSPLTEAWPGWLFYASTNFGPSNPFWRDLPELNAYIARCQSFLQAGKSDNDILLYFPIYDIWQDSEGMLIPLQVHNVTEWLYGSSFHDIAKNLWDNGYTFDYISDRQLLNLKVKSGDICADEAIYKTMIIPNCRFMSISSLKKLQDLAEKGATIIVHKSLPHDVPGFSEFAERRSLLKKMLSSIKFDSTEYPKIKVAKIGSGKLFIGNNLAEMLSLLKVSRETVVDYGIKFIRRAHQFGHIYFMTNLGTDRLDGWVQLGVPAASAVLFDPLKAKQGVAALRKDDNGQAQVYLQLRPGESIILKTLSAKFADNKPQWNYLQEEGNTIFPIKGDWQVRFIEGGPILPSGFTTKNLASWTVLGDSTTKVFSGTALYTITFEKPNIIADDWVLDLGKVCESARIRVNGHYLGALWSLPFRIALGGTLQDGENTLEIEVTNLGANRIADLDRRGVPWKKFYNINFVSIKYEPFDASQWPLMDSGLLGPVVLIPCSYKGFENF